MNDLKNHNHIVRALANALSMLMDNDLVNAEKAAEFALREIQYARRSEPVVYQKKEEGQGNVAYLAGVFILVVLAFFMLLGLAGHTGAAVSGAVSEVVAGSHAVERHGVGAESIREMFSSLDGRCSSGPSVEMKSVQRGTWMYICFPEDADKPSSWILSDQISDPLSREITAIPGRDMSRPVQYLRNVITRDGYEVVNSFGRIPAWFVAILF